MSAVKEVIGVFRTAKIMLDHTPVAVILATVSTVMDTLVMVDRIILG